MYIVDLYCSGKCLPVSTLVLIVTAAGWWQVLNHKFAEDGIIKVRGVIQTPIGSRLGALKLASFGMHISAHPAPVDDCQCHVQDEGILSKITSRSE